jgi:hypothetical protein
MHDEIIHMFMGCFFSLWGGFLMGCSVHGGGSGDGHERAHCCHGPRNHTKWVTSTTAGRSELPVAAPVISCERGRGFCGNELRALPWQRQEMDSSGHSRGAQVPSPESCL